MNSPHPQPTTDPDPAIYGMPRRLSLTVHHGRRLPHVTEVPPVARPRTENSPIKNVQAMAGAMFVVSMAACWIAVASTATAPLLAAGELLGRAAKASGKQA